MLLQMASAAVQQLPEEALPAWDGRRHHASSELDRGERKRLRARKKAAAKKRSANEVWISRASDQSVRCCFQL